MEEVKIIDYKNHKINIYHDSDFSDNPNDWNENIILVHYHSDFTIRKDGIITKDDCVDWFNGEKIAQEKDYHIFLIKSYIHSGIVMALEESGRIFPDERWDVSRCGCMLISKKETKSKKKAYKIASKQLEIWNQLNSGEVYGFVIDDDGDSCWGFIGDIDDCIEEAKRSVNCLVEEELQKRLQKTKINILKQVPLLKRV